ncbi:hypothetical protein ACOMHN_032262 [Nucella lapillus]
MLLSLLQQLALGPSNIQIGAVVYGNGAHNEFYLNEAANATQLANLVNAMTFSGGTADAAEAVRFAYTTSFSRAHGMRDGVPHIIVHITDGPSDNPAQLLQEAENAHNQSITIFNIGVGPGVEFRHLAKVASDPSSRYVLQANTFTSLSNMVPLLASRLNNEIPVAVQELPQPNSCLTKADLVLLIDSSSSVGMEDFGHLEDFVKNLAVQLPIGPDQVQLGLVQFSSHPSLEFPLNMYHDRMSVLKAVENLQFMGGGTNTGDALHYVTTTVYNKDGGARPGVPRVAVVITDGQSMDTVKTRLGAERARQNSIDLVAVGVGSHVNNQELTDIANTPESAYVFSANSYKDLKTLSSAILRATCTYASSTADPCFDKLDNCQDYSERSCTDYDTWAHENCRKRCGFCQTAEELSCEDKVQDCDSYGADVCSSDLYQQWAHENCKRFCGFCDGRCMYKGQAYIQSEKWQDGCDYECVCEDAKEGQYRCYNRCPVYHNLPPECTLVGVPNECCLKPVCNFHQTLITSQVAPGASYNAQNIAVCAYQGKQYFQGQAWDVGCDQKCVCTNATLGAYRCQSYCPTFPVLPRECHLVQEPGQCCRRPVCEFNTQTGSFTGFGTLSGRGVGMKVPSGAECVDVVVDCGSYGRATCTEEQGWAQVNCAKYCGFCYMCYYNGQNYTQGETWTIGCDTECVCEDAVYGYYRCYNSCPTYINLPNECKVVHQEGTCCEKIECSKGTFYPSSTNVVSVGNGGGLVVHGANGGLMDLIPTLPSGSTLPPGTFGGSTGLANIRLDGCLFNGQMYIQSQQWHDGCKHTCDCQDATTGHFSCRERCPKYNNVPSECGTQPDPNDPCCTMPNCSPALGYVAIPVYGRGVQSIGAVVTPNLPDLVNGMFTARFTMVFSGFTVAPPTAPTGSLKPGGLDYCEYHGQRYHQGERWEDGCDFNCVCEDASTGSWRCVDKCEKYVDLPVPYCHLEQDPVHPCCQRPVCNFQVGHGQKEGNNTLPPTTTTMKPTTPGYWEPKCIYKGMQYAVGQSWYDGCRLKCKCDNADKNSYTCVTRCPSYSEEYNGCQQLPDPQDPSCCVVPVCSPTSLPYLTPQPGVTQSPHLITPQIPIIPPGIVTGGNSTGYCEYNNVRYSQDDTWQNGCEYTCVCDDAQMGHYTCTQLCQRYGALPSTCRLISDYTNPCCSIPTCAGIDTYITGTGLPPTGSTPTSADVCVYNNAQFQQGQIWQEGCSKLCRCEDAKNGLYVCTDRCPRYDNYPPECTLVSDPEDACCLKPKCVPGVLSSTTLSPDPYLIPTLAPGKVVGNAIFPTPTPGPGGNTLVPSINYCIYSEVPYAQGDTWQDGCSYTCTCTNASIGRYECTERCPIYVTVPTGCIMVKDVSDPCCQRPVCNPGLSTPSPEVTYSPTPGVTGSTLSPPTGSTVSPGPVTTAQPKEVCVYKNEYYTQGQKWYDGCDFSCTCEDAKEGIYRCIERCPRYEALPSECSLGPDPTDPLCCQVPVCYMTPLQGSTAGYLIPPVKPGVVSGGSVTPSPEPRNTPTPGSGGVTLVPPQRTQSPRHVCVYNGQEYTQGQKWADGCDYDCECVDAFSGRYQCTEKCYQWSTIPAQCTLVTDPNNPCCQIPYCNTDISTPEPQSTIFQQPQTTRAPFIGPDGSTLSPPTIRTLSPHRNRCLYNGVPYMTGESWEDGCDLMCVCEDGASNIYHCDQRCNTYKLPENCVLVTDPEDPCCQVPSCEPVTQSTAAPGMVTTQVPPTGPDGSTLSPPTRAPNATPSKRPYLVPTGVTGTIIGSNNNPNKSESLGCIYDRVTYQQGEKWEDGCKQKCVCLNGNAGVYECTERCTRLLNVPPNCQLVIDPADPCCKTALCRPVSTAVPSATPSIGPQVTPVSGQTPNTGAPTPTASVTQVPKKMCVYQGQYYVEGQQWYDGCDKVCVCDDGLTNYYRCSDRCTVYTDVPTSCQMVASPEDPACCMVPQCLPTPGPTGYPTPGPNATPGFYTNPTGVITGTAPTPTPRPGYPTPAFRDACVYNGQEYKEGQQWQDGCDYNCLCVNSTTGYYRCAQRCPDYPVVPSQCSLVPDPLDFCCKQLKCDFNQTTPNPFSPTPRPTRIPDPNLHTATYLTPGQVTTVSASTGGGLPTPSNQPPTFAPQFTFCVYNGISYRQGETWKISCDKVCTCDDSTRNYYTCSDRCPTYPQPPSTCTMRVDPDDACCLVPECYLTPTLSPDATPAQVPGQTTAAPHLIPTGVPGVITRKPNTNTPTTQSGCEQNGVLYQPGDTWKEGCQYVCECLDTSGLTKCTERPLRLMLHDTFLSGPSDVCSHPGYFSLSRCVDRHTPVCCHQQSSAHNTFLPSAETYGDVCVYKGASYTESQQWYDGCDLVCVCEDSQTGFYRCSERCPTYSNVGADCKFVPDVRDPTCCMIPDCTSPELVNVTGNVGVITGNRRTPTPTPPQQTLSPHPGSTLEPPTSGPGVLVTPQPKTDVCVYNGRVYSQGQRWQDGCTYNCECVDATLGQYRCTDRCLRYPQNIVSFCTMNTDPQDPCCLVPDCDNTPTPLPGSTASPSLTNVTTVAPPLTSSPFPTLHPTQAPGVEFCVYKGIPYSHGQTWNDGCDKTCRCEDVVTGQVNCDDRCASYTEISADCQLVTDPQDSCCRVPDCHHHTTNNTVIVTGPVGVISGNSLPPNHRGPLTRNNVCIYHGRTYKEGEVWDDGCSYTCECVDANLGKYTCREKCERIVQLPPTCMMIKDQVDACCLKPYCPPWPTKEPTPEPGATPSSIPSVSPTAHPPITPTINACIYNGAAYRQDQLWYDDCNAVCKCEDAAVGFYRCQERCVHYTPNPGCIMVPDPDDPTCCEIPKCPLVTPTPQPEVSPTPGIVNVVTKTPGQIEGLGKVPTQAPTLSPTATPTPVTGPDGSTIATTPRPTTGCYYKGGTYQETEKWQDGCDFICECIDGTTGRYKCSEKCPILPDLPDRCVLVQSPTEPCCMVPYCDFVNPTPFPNGTPTPYPTLIPSQVNGTGPTSVPSGTPTPFPTAVPNGFCVYNGAYYREGETWSDACDLNCVCDNTATGLYTCKDRCKTYGELPKGCKLRVSPSDSCCLVPDCRPQPTVEVTPSIPGNVTGAQTPNPSFILVGNKPGSFTGTGGIGRPVGNYGTHTGFSNGCVYKNTLHQQNEVWEDGCDYMCVCVDALRGKYQCTDRCVSYFFLPQTCRMEPDPDDKCCQRARCYPEQPTTLPPPTTTPVVVTSDIGTGPSGSGSTVNPNVTAILVLVHLGAVLPSPFQGIRAPDHLGVVLPSPFQGIRALDYLGVVLPSSFQGIRALYHLGVVLPSPFQGIRAPDHLGVVLPSPFQAIPVLVRPGAVLPSPFQAIPVPDHLGAVLPSPFQGIRAPDHLGAVLPSPFQAIPVPDHLGAVLPSLFQAIPVPDHPGAVLPSPFQAIPVPDHLGAVLPSPFQGIRALDHLGAVLPSPFQAIPVPDHPGAVLPSLFQAIPVLDNPGAVLPSPFQAILVPDHLGAVLPSPFQGIRAPDHLGAVLPSPFQAIPVPDHPGVVLPSPLKAIPVPDHPGAVLPSLLKAIPVPAHPGAVLPSPFQGIWAPVLLEAVLPSPLKAIPVPDHPGAVLPSPFQAIPVLDHPGAVLPSPFQAIPVPDHLGAVLPSPFQAIPVPDHPGVVQPSPLKAIPVPDHPRAVLPSPFQAIPVPDHPGAVLPSPFQGIRAPVLLEAVLPSPLKAIPVPDHPGAVLPSPFQAIPVPDHPGAVLPSPFQAIPVPDHLGAVLPSPFQGIRAPDHLGAVLPSPFQDIPVPDHPGAVLPSPFQAIPVPDHPGAILPSPFQGIRAPDHLGAVLPSPFQVIPVPDHPGVVLPSPLKAIPVPDHPGAVLPSPLKAIPVPDHPGVVLPSPFQGIRAPVLLEAVLPSLLKAIPVPDHPGAVLPSPFQGIRAPVLLEVPLLLWSLQMVPAMLLAVGESLSMLVAPYLASLERRGIIYHVGESWDDGCDLRCTCLNTTQGLYTCTYRCPAYSSLPQYCHLQIDPNDICCKKPTCTGQGTQLVPEIGGKPTLSPTLAPSVINVIPLGTHTIISGSSRPPGQGVQTIFGGRSSCIYKRVEYIPGETWDDGCDFTCTCIGDNIGLYRCASKCPSYPALPSYCTLSPIPGKCCPSLSCDVPTIGIYTPIPQLEPNVKPTAGPNGIYPTPEPSVDPQLILDTGVGNMIGGSHLPGGGAKVPGGYLNNLGGIRDKCIYDLKMYNQGESWDVGCNYMCKCLDSMTGFYQCNERCISYDGVSLPSACKLVTDPRDICCKTPSCPDPTNTGHQITNITQIQKLYPIVGSFVGGTSGFRPGYVPTSSYGHYGGNRTGCVYKGQLHQVGARWDDGCDFSCTCMDSATGLYQCKAMCVTYSLLPPACQLVDVEGECCPKVHCNAITTHSPCRDKIDNCAQYRKEACTGAYAGWAREHCPLFCEFCTPSYTTTPAPCEDKLPNCKNFDGGDLCSSVAYQDWALTNCRKYCDVCRTTTVATTVWTTPESGCFDAISYCQDFGPSICTNPDYKSWIMKNCRKYCAVCSADTSVGSTTEAPCEDRKGTETCRLYGKSSCGGQFLGWAMHNCRKFCDLCGDVTFPTHPSVTTMPQRQCQDVLPNCGDYDRQYCRGAYLTWAADNCAGYCDLCSYELTTVSKVEEVGWLVLLKGVAGVTGDLWHLWNTTSVANQNVPQAQYLTNQYPGHYKPAIANQWDSCRFERVKVAILSGGIEKANIIFNVRNQGKNDWFKPENIVSSTFNDLPTTAGSFAIAKDPNSGNEFAVGSVNDCQGSGWIFISTNQKCPYQSSGAAPQFYYSLTNTVSHLAPGQLGEGDVFAILAQGGNCMSGVLSTQGTFTNIVPYFFIQVEAYKSPLESVRRVEDEVVNGVGYQQNQWCGIHLIKADNPCMNVWRVEEWLSVVVGG